MIDRIICFLWGHRWCLYPQNTDFHDYKVCGRCNKSITLSPYLTAGEIEYIEQTLINAVSDDLITRQSWFMKKDDVANSG